MTSTDGWSHTESWEPERTNVSSVRRFVSDLLSEHEQEGIVDDVRLVASELATNAVRHARTPFQVTLADLGDTVLLEVSDADPGLPVRMPRQVDRSSGHGLRIFADTAAAWGINSRPEGGKAVWALFSSPSPAPTGVPPPR